MISKFRAILGPNLNYPKPPLQQGEEIVREGVGARFVGLMGGRWGALILTNRRLIWFETRSRWPLKKISGQLELFDVVSIDKGSILDFLGGGRRIRLRLRSGKFEKLYEGDGKLDEWIEAIRQAAAAARTHA